MQVIPLLRNYRLAAASAIFGSMLMLAAGCDPADLSQEEEFVPAPAVAPSQAYLDAKTTLLQAAQNADPVVRANAIEAMGQVRGAQAGEVYLQGLRDEFPVVRVAAAMVIGDLKYAPALPALRRMSRTDPADPNATERDKMVACAVIYALHELGDDSRTQFLAELLFDSLPEVRMEAAMVMGKMGEPSALNPLKTALTNEQELPVQIQITESLAMLGDTRSADVLEAYTKGYWLDLRIEAIKALARTRTERAHRVLKELTASKEPARLRVVAGGELARISRPIPEMRLYTIRSLRDPNQMLKEAVEASRRAADDDARSLRLLAALWLGSYRDQTLINELQPFLAGGDPFVQVAAAESILRLMKDYRPLVGPTPIPRPVPAPAPVVSPAKAPTPPVRTEPIPVAPPTPATSPAKPAPVAPTAMPVVVPAPEEIPASANPGNLLPAPKTPKKNMKLKTVGGKD